MSSAETTSFVEPSQATASNEAARPPAHYAQLPVLALKLPPECLPVRVGNRVVYSPPNGMESEASEWNSIQYQIQELGENRRPTEQAEKPTEAGVDVCGSDTTREQLRSILAGEKYHIQSLADLEHFQAMKACETRLLRIIAQSEHISTLRRIAAAEAAIRRTVTARELLMRDAPAELHSRLAELAVERKKAIYDLSETGHIESNRMAWLKDQIAHAESMLSTDTPPPLNPQSIAYELREWKRQLGDREAKLAAIDAEVADIERRMLLA